MRRAQERPALEGEDRVQALSSLYEVRTAPGTAGHPAKAIRRSTARALVYIHVPMTVSQMARKMAGECPAMRARQASRALGRIFDDALRPLGLQLSQLPLLCAAAMSGEAGASIGALARAMVIDPTTLTRNIRPLEKAGLLRVARLPADRRVRVVLLTRSGERMIERTFPAWQRALAQAHAEFGADEIGELRARLEAIVAAAGGRVDPEGAAQRT